METEAEQTENRDTSNYDALLERAGELELWHGIRVDRLSAHYDRNGEELAVFGEIRPVDGSRLNHSLYLNAVLYDKSGRIVSQQNAYLSQEDFYGFEVVKIGFYGLTPEKMSEIGKIKVYPAQ